ncbi:peptidase M61 [Curvibacter sp. RS43]|uniref:M61 family metallopeptidase n=1 Tax=Curvibacter microcysteis TaxID=3026419 RepID=UPI002361B721|nr:peptidase M61 [Curvibacter sp. RS43]MDD0812531.1 peptidase M61 [Curvibacter sp. RS43]
MTRPTAPLHYRIDASQQHAHLFQVTLTIAQPAAQQTVSLPVWIPGSYLVREFSKNLQLLEARQNGRRIPLQQLDKCQWQVASQAGQALELRYEVYAFDNSVRTAWLDPQRGFFNGTSLCLRVHGQEDQPHQLELLAPDTEGAAGWRAATALTPVKVNRRGFGLYQAADYDELVDHPVELGDFWQGEFQACGITHQWVVAGATASFDSARLLRDSQQICETVIRFWHPDIDQGSQPAPIQRYVFMLNAVDDSYGGLEHRASTALICGRRDLPRLGEARSSEGYTTLLGLISHEYFHTWNVKRLRPAELARYDYRQENYTELLWFFEGFTSYYDDLLLRRAGLLDDAGYLKLLNKTLNQVLQTPGREVQSVAQASYDAWVKYYRQDENTANATVSYYTKGSLVALALDLSLRQQGHHLDEAMRRVWQRCQGGPMSEADFATVLQELTGRSWGPELQAWVHSTRELPLKALFQHHGVAWHDDPAQLAQRLGLRVAEKNGNVQIKTVLRGGAAEKAGLAANDEWLGIEVGAQGWRLGKLDDLSFYAGSAKRVTALVSRDQRLLRLPLALPAASTTVRLSIAQAPQVAAWLQAPAASAPPSPPGMAAPEPVGRPATEAAAAKKPRQRPLKTGARLVKKASTPSK